LEPKKTSSLLARGWRSGERGKKKETLRTEKGAEKKGGGAGAVRRPVGEKLGGGNKSKKASDCF